ncbi:hypothetical protein HOLleu_30825 [Holothuria leucospilota]|uniref:Uncharacterized protein n=1 Tax=Holothuria leucospilota TaxID=206669 RepID=A0A9Q1BKX4_HOLLE|nr:hypothetical protein HOLleu_30825 [Holothuria leucospilota]
MPYSKRKNPVIFGGVQRSSGVSGGQTLKTLLTRYLKVGSLDKFHTLYVDVPYSKRKNPIIFGGGQRSFGVT